MKKSEACVSKGKSAESPQSVGDRLEAPVRLTPDQLENVAAGFMPRLPNGTGSIVIGPPTITWGLILQPPTGIPGLYNAVAAKTAD